MYRVTDSFICKHSTWNR